MNAKKDSPFTQSIAGGLPRRAKAGERAGKVVIEDVVTHSARVPASLNQAIKKLAVEENTSLQALTIEALRLLLQARGIEE